MRRSFLLIVFISVASVVFSQGMPDPNFHLYLLIGQSNMAGRGKVDSLSYPNNNRILMLTKENEWVIANDPLHFDKPKAAGVGPGLRFAEKILVHQTNNKVRIGLIPCAVGGSPIEAWQPGKEFLGFHPYDDALSRLRLAMQSGILKGILWHQGESNSSEARSKSYLQQLIELIGRLRTEAGDQKVPFIAGELGYYRDRYQIINNILKGLPESVPNTAVATAEALTHKGDTTHLNSPSARLLGERFAERMIKLTTKKSDKKH